MADSGSNNLLVVNIAGLGHASIGEATPHLAELASAGCCSPVQPAVPALTGTSQATILTGTLPQAHGIVANGWYFRELSEILNWQRSARLVNGSPVWESFGKPPDSSRCANLFWRYATHATSQLNVTERPTYWVDGRKTPDIYTEPGDQRETLVKELGPFPLFGFWGPLAGIESTRWIVDATIRTIRQKLYGLVLSYLPHLDYDHQRFGPQSPQGIQALRDLDVEFGRLIAVARQHDMDVAVVSDYAFEAVTSPVYLNRVLRSEGLLAVQIAENGELLEPGYSRAFAVCDQQVAHIYVANDDDLKQVRQLVEAQEGVDVVYDRQQMQEFGLAHSRSGELFAIASPGHCSPTTIGWTSLTLPISRPASPSTLNPASTRPNYSRPRDSLANFTWPNGSCRRTSGSAFRSMSLTLTPASSAVLMVAFPPPTRRAPCSFPVGNVKQMASFRWKR